MHSGNEDVAIRYFSQRLLGIALAYRVAGESRESLPIVKIFSATVLLFENSVSLLTAGHVIAAINGLYEDRSLEVESCLLVDNLGIESQHDVPVPFDWRSADKAHLDEDGLDFGVVRLGPYYVKLLLQNGVKAITEDNWVKQHTLGRLDRYFMLGIPEELNPPRRLDPYGGLSLQHVMFSIQPLDGLPAHRSPPKNPIFVAQLPESLPVSEIGGMSGGPIIGMRIESDDRLVYWIVALVRSSVMSERLVTGCPLPVLGGILRSAFDRLDDN